MKTSKKLFFLLEFFNHCVDDVECWCCIAKKPHVYQHKKNWFYRKIQPSFLLFHLSLFCCTASFAATFFSASKNLLRCWLQNLSTKWGKKLMENGKDTLQITTKKPLKIGFHFLQKIFMTVRQFSKYSYVFEMLSKIDILCRHDKTNSRRALQIQTHYFLCLPM